MRTSSTTARLNLQHKNLSNERQIIPVNGVNGTSKEVHKHFLILEENYGKNLNHIQVHLTNKIYLKILASFNDF